VGEKETAGLRSAEEGERKHPRYRVTSLSTIFSNPQGKEINSDQPMKEGK